MSTQLHVTLDASSPLHAISTRQRRRGDFPRCFVLHWDTHKIRTRTRTRARDAEGWHECYGTRYPGGTVTLETGQFWRDLSEMEASLSEMGSYRLEWLDEDESDGEATGKDGRDA